MRRQHRGQEEKENRDKQVSDWHSNGRRYCHGRRGRRKERNRKVAGFWLGMLLVFLFAFAGTLALLTADERCAQVSGQPAVLVKTVNLLESTGERIEGFNRR